MPKRAVVITGIGVVSPIGIGLESFRRSISQGESGVRRLPLADEVDLPYDFGADLRDFDGKSYIKPRKSIKLMCREIQTGFAAGELAAEQAGIVDGGLLPDRLGVVFGSEMFSCDVHELANAYRICMRNESFVFDEWAAKAINELYPLWMLKYLPNMTACHIGIRHDARGPNNTITQTEASSLLALIEAAFVIERGDADVMFAGGSGSRLPLASMLYHGDINVSKASEPQSASRPFDRDRDGMVNGEGAAAFVLESEEHARARGARILAYVRGWGSSFAVPGEDKAGLQTAIAASIRLAMQRSEISAEDVGHVNAHGLSTISDDRCEALAIRDCLGDVPVTAPKSFFGNLGAGGGAVEAAASLIGLAEREIPFTLNTREVDPGCPINVVRTADSNQARSDSALLLNHAATGQSAAVLICSS